MIYGMMLDSGRVIERHDFYFELIPWLAKWGYNTLFWHFSDNEECALRFECEPELASKHALSAAKTRELVQHAKAHNIEIIPELESLGHTKYITDLPKFNVLVENIFSHTHATLCTEHPLTLELMERLLAETMDIFASSYVHVGMDESIFDTGCQRCSVKRSFDGVEGLVADYIGKIHRIIASRGKKMMIWADMVLKHKKILDMIPKDIVLCNWEYTTGKLDIGKIKHMTDRGFQVINCPSITSAVLPDNDRLDNVKEHIRISREFPEDKVIGVMNTSWEAWRHLQGAIIPGIAVAGGVIANNGRTVEDFAREYFACASERSVSAVAGALNGTFSINFSYNDLNALCPACALDLRFFDPGNMGKYQQNVALCNGILDTLKEEERHVKKNMRHYQDILLSVEIALKLSALAPFIQELKDKKTVTPRKMDSFAGSCEELYEKCVASWNETRYPDDPRRDQIEERHQYNESIIYHLRATGDFVRNLKQ